jgi:hypothetical protein
MKGGLNVKKPAQSSKSASSYPTCINFGRSLKSRDIMLSIEALTYLSILSTHVWVKVSRAVNSLLDRDNKTEKYL